MKDSLKFGLVNLALALKDFVSFYFLAPTAPRN